jgi:hypothetical protein
MQLAPAIIIHSLQNARAALAPGRPVTLLSARGAALYAGCLWWAELLKAANHSGASLLDCADAPGRALEALKLGLPGIVLTCEPAAYKMVAAIAAAQNAILLPKPPPALDLAAYGALRKISAWLDDTTGTMG